MGKSLQALTSGAQSQTVTASNAMTPIVYTAPKMFCVTSINDQPLVSQHHLVMMVTISGTPSAQSTGVFNYNITLTGSSSNTTVVGAITVVEPSTLLIISMLQPATHQIIRQWFR